MVEVIDKSFLMSLTANIVEKHVSNNQISTHELPGLISLVYSSLENLLDSSHESFSTKKPLVSIEDSIQPDHIICLEDGRKLKMLKRYLKRAYNLTPDQYRQKWGLPANYPMVAPNYSKKRSALAKGFGLGARYSKA